MTARPSGPEIGKHLNRYRQIATVLTEEGLHATIDAAGLRRVAPMRARVRAVAEDHLTDEHYRGRRR